MATPPLTLNTATMMIDTATMMIAATDDAVVTPSC